MASNGDTDRIPTGDAPPGDVGNRGLQPGITLAATPLGNIGDATEDRKSVV